MEQSRVPNQIAIGINHPTYNYRLPVDFNNCGKKHNGYYDNIHYGCNSIHAEDMAIDKLPHINCKRRKKINILVIRITSSSNSEKYKLVNSQPCKNCVEKMSYIQGYKVKKIYYSNENGEIVCCKLRDLANKSQHITKFNRYKQ